MEVLSEFPSEQGLIKIFLDAHCFTYRAILAHKTQMFKCDKSGDAFKIFGEELAGDILSAKTFDKVESSRQ